MAEQYIYSRAEREFTNALNQTVPVGFGFLALSPGMNDSLKRDAAIHCEDCPRLSQTDSQGVPLPLFRKASLSNGRVLFQESAWIEKGSRDFHVAHGYVLDDKEVRSAGPAKWLSMSFQLGDPNAETEPVPLARRLELTKEEIFRAKTLKETMEVLELSQPFFCQILLACFDALASRRQVLIAWDFERPGEQDLRRSVLYWIYTCLPYEMWSRLDFDSVYTDKSSPGLVQLAFVDITSVRDGGQTLSIQLKNRLNPLGGNFLIRDGRIIHNDGKYPTDWYGKNSVYARWLRETESILLECPEEQLPSVTQALAEFYQSFQELLNTRGDCLTPQWYDTVCIRSLSGAPQALSGLCSRVKDSITESELYDFRLAFMSSFTAKEQNDILHDIFKKYEKGSAPAGENDIKLLCGMYECGQDTRVTGLVSAFMAQETDVLGEKVSAVLKRYQELVPSKLYPVLLERIFFSKTDGDDIRIWLHCGVDHGGEAAKQRRDAWFMEKLPANKAVWDLPASIRRVLADLNGLNAQQQAEFWQEYFRLRCQAVSREDLESFADKGMPQRLCSLEDELSDLPGGIPKDALETLQQKAYDQLLSAPASFMDNQWLNTVCSGRKIGGEVGEALEILSAFTNAGKTDINSWICCCSGRSKAAQNKAFAVLFQMFCNGALPAIPVEFIISFLFLSPEDSRKILLRASSQGGGKLLSDLLIRARKYPWKYSGRLGSGEQTIFLTITKIISNDWEIANALKARDGERTSFYEDMNKFLQEPETVRALSPGNMLNAIDHSQCTPPAENNGGRQGSSGRRR